MNTENDQENLAGFESAWDHIACAITELEAARVGLDKDLYQDIDRIRALLIDARLSITLKLIEPALQRQEDK